MDSCELYRHFNNNGALLYVGISNATVVRLGQHKLTAKWFKLVDYITIQRFKTREDAKAAESRAIAVENPVFNLAEADGWERPAQKPLEKTDNYLKNTVDEWIGGWISVNGDTPTSKPSIISEFKSSLGLQTQPTVFWRYVRESVALRGMNFIQTKPSGNGVQRDVFVSIKGRKPPSVPQPNEPGQS